MSAEIDFVPFATGAGANVLSQSAYLANSQTSVGQQPGVASSALNNKALRQATYMAACLANFLSDRTGNNILDDGNMSEVLATMALAWPNTTPTQTVLTATGTTAGYLFTCSSANATVGATYTNSGHTYTVLATIAAGTLLFCSGTSAPASSGTLTKATGTGDSTITYSAEQPLAQYVPPTGVTWLGIEMVGGSGGGSGGYTGGSPGSGAGSGTISAFGSGLLVCLGGVGRNDVQGANGGSASLGGATGIAVAGSAGNPGINMNSTSAFPNGGNGGCSPFSGAATGGTGTNAGGAASPNSGSGGGGGGASTGLIGGGGGGSGGYIKAVLPTPAASYYYAVGSGGAGGPAGTGGQAGGNGSAGVIIITEHYGA